MSKRKKKNYIIIGDGMECKCGKSMERIEKENITASMLNKQYYFHTYDYCPSCKRIVLDDKNRVYNNKVKVTVGGVDYSELERQANFFRDIG